jgi:KRAB domain-containing zinc finger protein
MHIIWEVKNCGKQFRNKPILKQPVAITHLGQREFQCQECGKSFTRVSTLKVHKLTHNNEIPYRCEFCSQGYKEKRNLMKHTERQHPNAFTYNKEQMKSNSTNEHIGKRYG